MDELPDIATMKVAELKKQLKARGLSTTGNKVELIERLQLAVVPVEDTSDLLDEDNDLLADDSATNLSKEEAEEAPQEEEEEEEEEEVVETSVAADVPDVQVSKPQGGALASPLASPKPKSEAADPAVEAAGSLDSSTTPSGKKRITAPDDTAPSKEPTSLPDDPADDSKPKSLTDAERAAARAARFGLTPSADVEKKKASRAERFGLPASGKIGASPSVDMETLKKRAERFGQSSSTTMKKMELEEQMGKRRERFGSEEAAAEKKAKVVVNENLLVDEKLQKRAERFGAEVKA